MLKRLIIALLMVAFVFNAADARKRSKSKAGEIEDGVYHDKTYEFKLNIPEDWNCSIKKEKEQVRLVMTKKQYDVPIAFVDNPTFTKIPKISVFVDTINMPLNWFVDSLLAEDKIYNSKQKKNILQCCEILYGDYVPRQNTKMSIGDIEGLMISGEKKYTIEIPDVYTNYYGGSIFFIKEGNTLVLFHFICENLYFQALYPEFVKIIEGFAFTNKESTETETEKEKE